MEEAGLEVPVEARLLDLVSEVGELEATLEKYRGRIAPKGDPGSGR